MSTAQKIIFLDIDGPVIPWKNRIAYEGTGIKPPHDAIAVHYISKIAEHTGAQFVISSSARKVEKEAFITLFESFGFDASLLHEDWRTSDRNDRLQEIHEWIEKHPEVTHWIALDDEPLDTDHLVMACSSNGFLLSNYDEALHGLGLKSPKISNLFYWKARIGFEGPRQILEAQETQNVLSRLRIPGRQP